MPNNNQLVVPEAKTALDSLKFETANEVGIPNYSSIDKGDLPSKVNGAVGGHMVRKMVQFAEEAMKESPKQPL